MYNVPGKKQKTTEKTAVSASGMTMNRYSGLWVSMPKIPHIPRINILRRIVKKGGFYNGEEINNIQQGTDQKDAQKNIIPGLDSAESKKPFTDKTGDRRRTTHTDSADRKSHHGNRHLFADAGHLADFFLAGDYHNGAGTKKERNFHKAVEGNMHHCAFYAERT